MGGKDEKETKKKIREKMSTKISMKLSNKVENFTKNVNKSVTNNTMNVSNEMVNEFKNSTSAQAVAENILNDVTIMASGGAEIDINQDASAKLEMAAIVNILSSNEQKNTLANKVTNALKASIENDAQLKSDLQQAAKVQEMSEKAEGFGNMVGNMVDKFSGMAENMVKSLTGGSSSEKSEADIERTVEKSISQSLENEIKNTNINENDIVNSLEVEIKNSFKNMTQDECLGSAKSRNLAEKLKLLADTGAKIKVLQVAKADAIAKCISTKKIGNKALSGLANDNSYKAVLDSKNTSKSGASGKQDADASKTTKERDAINDSLDKGIGELGETTRTGLQELGDIGQEGIKETGKTVREGVKEMGATARMGMGIILLPVIIIGLIIVAVVGFKLAGNAGNSDEEEYYDEEMEGGNVLDLAEIFDSPLATRGLTLIVVFVMLDIILKKTTKKN